MAEAEKMFTQGLAHSKQGRLILSVSQRRWGSDVFGVRCLVPSFRCPSRVPAGGRVLQIPLARAEDAGRYSCKASNEAGEDWLHYELLVLSEWPAWGWRASVAGPHGGLPADGVKAKHTFSPAVLGGGSRRPCELGLGSNSKWAAF